MFQSRESKVEPQLSKGPVLMKDTFARSIQTLAAKATIVHSFWCLAYVQSRGLASKRDMFASFIQTFAVKVVFTCFWMS